MWTAHPAPLISELADYQSSLQHYLIPPPLVLEVGHNGGPSLVTVVIAAGLGAQLFLVDFGLGLLPYCWHPWQFFWSISPNGPQRAFSDLLAHSTWHLWYRAIIPLVHSEWSLLMLTPGTTHQHTVWGSALYLPPWRCHSFPHLLFISPGRIYWPGSDHCAEGALDGRCPQHLVSHYGCSQWCHSYFFISPTFWPSGHIKFCWACLHTVHCLPEAEIIHLEEGYQLSCVASF